MVDPLSAAALEQSPSGGGRFDRYCATVISVWLSPHEAIALETIHDPGHRCRANTFRGRELAERDGTAEDDHRKRAEARRADPRCGVLLARPSQQMDRGRMQEIGDGLDLTAQLVR